MFFFSFYPDTFCAPLLGACVKIQENKIKWCCLLAFCFCTHVSSDCGLTLRCAVRFSLTGAFCVTKNCTECQFWVVCVRVRANERDREQALSQAVNAHTHRTHSLLLLFFLLFFSLLASLFLVRWRGFVRYVLCDKRPPNPASERERSESKAKHIYSLAVLESLLTPAKLSCQSARTVTTCRQTITN